jgi:hypothetical protein
MPHARGIDSRRPVLKGDFATLPPAATALAARTEKEGFEPSTEVNPL